MKPIKELFCFINDTIINVEDKIVNNIVSIIQIIL